METADQVRPAAKTDGTGFATVALGEVLGAMEHEVPLSA